MRLALVGLAALSAVAAALPAAASPHHGGPPPGAPAVLRVKALSVVAAGHGVNLSMELDQPALHRLRRRGLDPGLSVDLGTHIEVIPITRVTEAQLRTRRPPVLVTVQVVDRSPRARRDAIALALGGVLVESVKLPVQRPIAIAIAPPPPPPVVRSEHPNVIDACRDALPHRLRAACEQTVAHVRTNPAPLIRACDRTFIGGDDTLTCIRLGLTAVTAPAPLIEACDRALIGNADTLACMRTTFATPRSLVEDLAACDRAFIGAADTLTCLNTAQAEPVSIAPVVDQCDATFLSNHDEQQCIAHLAPIDTSIAVELIQTCADQRGHDRAEMTCIEHRVDARVAHRDERPGRGRGRR